MSLFSSRGSPAPLPAQMAPIQSCPPQMNMQMNMSIDALGELINKI